MESCPGKLNRERGEALAPSKSIEAPAQASACSGWSFAQESYSWKLYLSSLKHDGKKRAFPKASNLSLKALLIHSWVCPGLELCGSDAKLLLRRSVTQFYFMFENLSIPEEEMLLLQQLHRWTPRALQLGCSVKACSWPYAGSGPCPWPAWEEESSLDTVPSLLQLNFDCKLNKLS